MLRKTLTRYILLSCSMINETKRQKSCRTATDRTRHACTMKAHKSKAQSVFTCLPLSGRSQVPNGVGLSSNRCRARSTQGWPPSKPGRGRYVQCENMYSPSYTTRLSGRYVGASVSEKIRMYRFFVRIENKSEACRLFDILRIPVGAALLGSKVSSLPSFVP